MTVIARVKDVAMAVNQVATQAALVVRVVARTLAVLPVVQHAMKLVGADVLEVVLRKR